MTGGGNSDRFFRALDDVISDLITGEVFDVLETLFGQAQGRSHRLRHLPGCPVSLMERE